MSMARIFKYNKNIKVYLNFSKYAKIYICSYLKKVKIIYVSTMKIK